VVDDNSRPAAAEPAEQRPTVEFRLDPHSPSKRPEQLAALVESALRREFPAAAQVVEVVHSAADAVISLRNLEQVDGGTAEKLAHRARTVYNDFMINPWY
jgi:hypothetical protein